jgi:hypothetical protein
MGAACDCSVKEEVIAFIYEKAGDWGLHGDLGVSAAACGGESWLRQTCYNFSRHMTVGP